MRNDPKPSPVTAAELQGLQRAFESYQQIVAVVIRELQRRVGELERKTA
jgi:hypothetical protein